MDTKVADPLRGALVGGRYRIMGRLAGGSATSVYQARDERLDRSVALRIVNPEFVLDADVIDRLANEAQTVARLGHPNVVAIFDQGSHEGAPYLVMEYVRGRTLREVVADRGRLDPAESLAIVEQILAALAVAHRAGLVHRAVKPENILVAPPPNGSGDLVDAVVKVADFGLARAADISRSQVSPMLGSTPYLAPELIADGRADTRADVYSVGVVLFEMLTGQLPFGGSAEAWRHVDEEPPPPSHLVEGIPATLDDLVSRATRRDPGQRPRDAAAMLREIQTTREDVGALAGPTRALSAPTVVVPAVPADAERPGWTRLPGQRARGQATPGPGGPDPGALTRVVERIGAAGGAVGDWARVTGNRLRYTAAGRRALVSGVVVLGILLMVGGWWLGAGRYTSAPMLISLTKDNAIVEAERLGFHVTFGASMHSETVPADTVLTQQPPPGGRIVRGGTVTVYLSMGPERYAVPDITGQELGFALTRIPSQFVVEQVTGYSDSLPVGYVAGTVPPAGTMLAPGEKVQVSVVSGRFPVHVPSVVGRSLEEAQDQLRANGFTDIVVDHRDDDAPRDQVLEQTPDGGTGMVDAAGQQVRLVVSNGPKLPMPDVMNQACGSAESQLRGLGLDVEVEGNAIEKALGKVRAQDPLPNTPLQPDQHVKIACAVF